MIIQFGVTLIDTEDDYKELLVDIEGNPRWENDSFSYAGTHCTGGQSGICELPSYTILDDDVTWDKTKFTDEQNEIIKLWVNSNTDYIEEKFCKKLREQPDY